ncbi:MAG: hypothetical protein Q4B48_06805 [Syntrophomonadaceae bacterium]|nr:hypothetical protein [Syntrophomonadaceae bacterium]
MVIQTLERRYHIIQVLETTSTVEIMQCRELTEDKNELNTLIRLKSPAAMQAVIPLLVEQQSNQAFEDFVECFSQGGDFYLIFRYHPYPPLRRALRGERYMLVERLEIAKSLLSRMTLLNMPACIQLEALRERNLVVDDSLTVHFNYYLTQFPEYAHIDITWVQRALAENIELLFPEELKSQTEPRLNRFHEQLEAQAYRSYIEIYGEFDQIYYPMKLLLEQTPEEPQGFLFRLWAKIKAMARYAKPALFVAIVGVAFIYLIYTMTTPASPSTMGSEIDQIGTVTIRE